MGRKALHIGYSLASALARGPGLMQRKPTVEAPSSEDRPNRRVLVRLLESQLPPLPPRVTYEPLTGGSPSP